MIIIPETRATASEGPCRVWNTAQLDRADGQEFAAEKEYDLTAQEKGHLYRGNSVVKRVAEVPGHILPELVNLNGTNLLPTVIGKPYDIARNHRWLNVGIDHDTADFVVDSIRHWWKRMGLAPILRLRN